MASQFHSNPYFPLPPTPSIFQYKYFKLLYIFRKDALHDGWNKLGNKYYINSMLVTYECAWIKSYWQSSFRPLELMAHPHTHTQYTHTHTHIAESQAKGSPWISYGISKGTNHCKEAWRPKPSQYVCLNCSSKPSLQETLFDQHIPSSCYR